LFPRHLLSTRPSFSSSSRLSFSSLKSPSPPRFFPLLPSPAEKTKKKNKSKVRFELGYYGLQPDIKVISPWREWDLNSRSRLISYAEERGIAVPASKR